MKALVVTPTTGAQELLQNILSVQQQSFVDTHHLVVVDGQEYVPAVDQILSSLPGRPPHLHRCDLPFNTGGGGWYGHRIMAAFSHLTADFDYVLFLDQDNWLQPNHVETLIQAIQTHGWHWAYALRQVYSKDGTFVCDDRCESLGRQPVYWTPSLRLIDSSAYCFTNAFLRQVGHHWDYGWGADRVFYEYLWKRYQHENYGTTGLHTLCYRLGGSDESVQAWMFLEGNKPPEHRHPDLQAFIDRVRQEQGLL